ncbi:MAG: FAD-dependent oxidoreductase [Hyphomonadaceae bacterium]|nr:FAD-dependent oxidoreductase [Hyphomonadaceae bacterium]
MTLRSIAVVGAGAAGLACARRLSSRGFPVRLFDKGRSPGGRLATRRVQTPHGEAAFDHGAQYVTARDPAFADVLATLALPWTVAPVVIAGDGRIQPGRTDGLRWVGAPGMSALARGLAAGLSVTAGARVTAASRTEEGWRLAIEGGEAAGPFDAVVIATPAEQAGDLLAPTSPAFAEAARAAVTAPCWAGLLVFADRVPAPFDAARVEGDGPIAWIARERSKPGRAGPEAWVVHAAPTWSREHLEDAPDAVADALARAFRVVAGAAPAPAWTQAHRWRYAQVERAAGTPFAWDAALRLGVCGDWRIGPRVESAWLSGDGLARAMAG